MEEKLMYCSNCGKKVGDGITVCPKCGGTEFSNERRKARFSGTCILWMLISLVANAALGGFFMFMGLIGNNPNINFVFRPPFFEFVIDQTGEFNLVLFIMGLLVAVYSLVYIILLVAKKQFLYGVLMVAAISLASFMFFFYGASVLSIIMIPVLLVFPSVTRAFIGGEWDYMG